ncbi:hypothetical protein B0H13DRAFT_2351865 [Mycena leptocephala]|nr:hypothetical protein B0H13DRAFT_2351865 [Mycena leptocephala]
MSKQTADKIPKGPPQELISRITHLHNLLRNLPASLPENPPHFRYQFYFDNDRLEMGGYFSAAGHAINLTAKLVIEESLIEGLSTADAEEDIWVFNDKGQMWTKIEEFSARSGDGVDDDDSEECSGEDDS